MENLKEFFNKHKEKNNTQIAKLYCELNNCLTHNNIEKYRGQIRALRSFDNSSNKEVNQPDVSNKSVIDDLSDEYKEFLEFKKFKTLSKNNGADFDIDKPVTQDNKKLSDGLMWVTNQNQTCTYNPQAVYKPKNNDKLYTLENKIKYFDGVTFNDILKDKENIKTTTSNFTYDYNVEMCPLNGESYQKENSSSIKYPPVETFGEVVHISNEVWSVIDNEVVLVIGDLHLPYTHKDYLQFNIDLAKKYQVNKIIFIGDIVDNHAISYHEHNPNLPSAGDELNRAKEMLKDWYNAFPNAIVLKGNHDLFDRKIHTAGLPKECLKSMNDIYDIPRGWIFVDEYETDKHYFNHGTTLSENTIKTMSLVKQKSVIVGHAHTLSYVKNITQNLWVSHIGCGIDAKALAFAYAKGQAKPQIMSSLIINKLQPILELM